MGAARPGGIGGGGKGGVGAAGASQPAQASPGADRFNYYQSLGQQQSPGLASMLGPVQRVENMAGPSGPAIAVQTRAPTVPNIPTFPEALTPNVSPPGQSRVYQAPDRMRGMEVAPRSQMPETVSPQAPSGGVQADPFAGYGGTSFGRSVPSGGVQAGIGPQPNISAEQVQALTGGWQQDRDRAAREQQNDMLRMSARQGLAPGIRFGFGNTGGGNYGDPRFAGLLALLGRGGYPR